MDESSFWKNQPVGIGESNEIIKMPLTIRTEPFSLPEGFVFENIHETKELSKFLYENYVEDVNEQFRLVYSEKFLHFILNNPKHKQEYSLGLKFNNSLVGYVFAKETNIVINNLENKIAAVNFLCVNKDFRNKKIAPILIREITRRFYCNGVFSGIFTSGTDLKFNICTSRYYHYPINTKKLLYSNFANTINDVVIKERRDGTRKINEFDISAIYVLYQKYVQSFYMYENFDFEDFKHLLLSDEYQTYVYIEENKILSFGSFFILETLNIEKNAKIKGAYLGLVGGDKINKMIEDLIFYSNKEKCDVFNCIDIGNNFEFIEKLNFLEGTGDLKYYLYNWKTRPLKNEEIYFYMQ